MDISKGTPVDNADRAQGLGHRLRKSQSQTLPRRTYLLDICLYIPRFRVTLVDIEIQFNSSLSELP